MLGKLLRPLSLHTNRKFPAEQWGLALASPARARNFGQISGIDALRNTRLIGCHIFKHEKKSIVPAAVPP